jgi:hypothetical protein
MTAARVVPLLLGGLLACVSTASAECAFGPRYVSRVNSSRSCSLTATSE